MPRTERPSTQADLEKWQAFARWLRLKRIEEKAIVFDRYSYARVVNIGPPLPRRSAAGITATR